MLAKPRPDKQSIYALGVLVVVAGGAMLAFMTVGAGGRWDFVLPFRGTKLAAMLLVGYAIAVSTVLFQTITNNRILTPSIMGFDALYLLIQTVIVFALGSGALITLDHRLLFLIEAASMIVFANLLYRLLFSGGLRSLHLMLLVGIVLGILFRSLTNLMHRMIDPTDFVVLQDRFFANFNTIDQQLLAIATVVVFAASAVAWRLRHVYDVLLLGRDTAVSLGVEHRRAVSIILSIVATFVSISTALVGPVTFFGLLVANAAYQIIPSHRHAIVIPAAVLVAFVCLVGGQLVLEQIFAFDTALSIVIEFLGGIVFILLVVRGAVR